MNTFIPPIADEATLVVFCKRPLLNQGKTRLASSIGAKAAYLIAVELLNCALDDAMQWPGNVVLTISHPEDFEWACQLMDREYSVVTQPIGNLGVRINHMDKVLREKRHERLAFIGTDAPMLTPYHYQQTIAALNDHSYVLSRADDGGVGIMANARPWPDIRQLPWSTDALCDGLLALCLEEKRSSNVTTHMILPSYDIDEIQDLFKALQNLKSDTRGSRHQLLAVIEQIIFEEDQPSYA